jgi:hypothetical protein
MTDSTSHPALWEKMRALADQCGMPAEHPLRVAASELEMKVSRAYSDDGTKQDVKAMLGAWARARRLWSDFSGEPLI